MIKIVQSSCQASEFCFKTNSYGDCVRSSRSGVAGSVNFPDKLCGARVPYVKCPGAVDGFGNRNYLEEAMGGTGGSGSSSALLGMAATGDEQWAAKRARHRPNSARVVLPHNVSAIAIRPCILRRAYFSLSPLRTTFPEQRWTHSR